MTGPDAPVFVDYFDGRSAVPRRMELTIDGTRLLLIPAEGSTIVWPLDRMRRLPDQAGGDGLTLAPADGGPARLYIPDGAADLADVLRAAIPARAAPPPIPNFRARLVGLSAAALTSVALILFVLVPLMADQLATLLPPEGEAALGDATLEQIRSALDESGRDGLDFCTAAPGRAALGRMTDRLAKHTEFPFPLKVHVLDHEMVNAFALPGGHVVLFRGLIDAANDPDEVAAVLAHEMGHVAGRDATRGALRSAGSIGILGLIFGDFAGGTVALFLANQLIEAQYSQATEERADAYGIALMQKAGLPPEALGRFFETLRQQEGARDERSLLDHLSSHPALLDRIAAAGRAARPAQVSPVLNSSDWQALRAICR